MDLLLSSQFLTINGSQFATDHRRTFDFIHQRLDSHHARGTFCLPAVFRAFIPADSQPAAARLKEAGLQFPAEDWTRDDFLKYAQALTSGSKYGYAFDNSGVFVSAMPWIYANGGSIVSDDFCKPTVTDPKVEDALQFMHDLIYKYKVAPAPTSLNTLFQSLQTGDVAMIGVGRWALCDQGLAATEAARPGGQPAWNGHAHRGCGAPLPAA